MTWTMASPAAGWWSVPASRPCAGPSLANPKIGRFLALYGREGRCIAVVEGDDGRWLPAYAAGIAAAAPLRPGETIIDRAGSRAILAPGFS